MLEDELKETFEELNTQPLPRTFGAVDVVHRGRRVRVRRRAFMVAGSGLGTAALVAVVAVGLSRVPETANDPATPPGPASVTTTAPPTSATTAPDYPSPTESPPPGSTSHTAATTPRTQGSPVTTSTEAPGPITTREERTTEIPIPTSVMSR